MKDADINLKAFNDSRTEILKHAPHFSFALLLFSSLLSSYQLFFYANIYTKFKAIYMKYQSPALEPRLQQV